MAPSPQHKQLQAAYDLLGREVRFAHETTHPAWRLVDAINAQGMVQLAGVPGWFAPHLFVVREGGPVCPAR